MNGVKKTSKINSVHENKPPKRHRLHVISELFEIINRLNLSYLL